MWPCSGLGRTTAIGITTAHDAIAPVHTALRDRSEKASLFSNVITNCRKLAPRQGFLFDASERYAQARPSDLWHGGDQRTSGAALGRAEKSAAHERAAEPSESERWPVSWPATRSASLTSADTCLPAWSRVTPQLLRHFCISLAMVSVAMVNRSGSLHPHWPRRRTWRASSRRRSAWRAGGVDDLEFFEITAAGLTTFFRGSSARPHRRRAGARSRHSAGR
jgi:hypothetical protein